MQSNFNQGLFNISGLPPPQALLRRPGTRQDPEEVSGEVYSCKSPITDDVI